MTAVDPGFIREQMARNLHVEESRAILYGTDPATGRARGYVRRAADGHLYRREWERAAEEFAADEHAGARPLQPALPPTRTEEETMAEAEYDPQDTQPMPAIWTEVRIVLPPGADPHAVLDSLVATADGDDSGWYEVNTPEGALGSVGPCPAPISA